MKNRSTLALALAAGAFVWAQTAPAQADDLSFELPVFGQTTFSMTSTTTARYRGSNYDTNLLDDDFGSLQQRFDLALQGDELRLEVRLDAFVPFGFGGALNFAGTSTAFERSAWFGSSQIGCPEARAELCYLAWDARPERIVLRWEHQSWSLELGDAQLVFGRGVALSFRKVDLIGIDNALRGAHVRFDDGHFRVRLHAGLANPQNQDPITLSIFQDPADILAAASVGSTFGPSDMINVSAHAVRAWFEEEGRDFFQHTSELNYDTAVDVLGWTAEAPSLADGHLALYAEANALRRTTELGTADESASYGRAIYASAQVQTDNVTILAEWKDYSNFLVARTTLEGNPWRIYSAAPSLEFDGPQRLRAIGNQRGGSLRIDYAFLPGPWQFSVNGSVFGLNERQLADHQLADPFDGVLVTHGWATLQRRQEYDEEVTWSVSASAGYRQETFLKDDDVHLGRAGDVDRRMIHGLVEATVGQGEHSFDLNVDHRFEQEHVADVSNPGRMRDFQIGGVSLTYSYNVQLAVSLNLRWSNFNVGENTGRDARDYNVLGGEMYPSIEGRWNFDPGTYVKLFFGSTPGGQICSGGVCRQVPPFEGGYLQFVGRL